MIDPVVGFVLVVTALAYLGVNRLADHIKAQEVKRRRKVPGPTYSETITALHGRRR